MFMVTTLTKFVTYKNQFQSISTFEVCLFYIDVSYKIIYKENKNKLNQKTKIIIKSNIFKNV